MLGLLAPQVYIGWGGLVPASTAQKYALDFFTALNKTDLRTKKSYTVSKARMVADILIASEGPAHHAPPIFIPNPVTGAADMPLDLTPAP